MQRKKRTGGVRVVPQGRTRRSKLDAVSDWLRTRVEAEPDMTMGDVAERGFVQKFIPHPAVEIFDEPVLNGFARGGS